MGKAENFVEGYLEKQCSSNDFLCFKFVSPGRRGVPDRIIIAKGYVVLVETKSKIGHLSEIQKVRIKEILDRGGEVHVINTRCGVDDLIDDLKHRRKRASAPTDDELLHSLILKDIT